MQLVSASVYRDTNNTNYSNNLSWCDISDELQSWMCRKPVAVSEVVSVNYRVVLV
jgi:hypothetical protein